MANIFNIAANYHFFASFTAWLEESFGDKISDAKIFFPNRRSVREFQFYYGQKFGENAKQPRTKAIADISYEDFLDSFPKNQIKPILDEINKFNCLEGFDYLFFLSREISKTKVFGENINFSQAFGIAIQLRNLFDDIEREEIDLELLYQIDDSDLALHRQFTLDFLKKFYLRIKNSVLKNNVISPVSYQNMIIRKLGQSVEDHGLKSPLIIAGSTGSVNYSKKFIKSIAQDKNGYVVLYGLNKASIAVDDEMHPQFILNELLKFIGVEKSNVKAIAYENYKICLEQRNDFLSAMMLPSQETYRWQLLDKKIDAEKINQDIAKNFSYIEAKNQIEEARIIATAALEAFNENKKIAIIANDKNFVELLKAQLNNFSLSYNDVRSLDLSDSNLINLILLLLEIIENDFDSIALLALLKNISQDKIVNDFEINIIRQQRKIKGLHGLKNKLKSADENLQNFFSEFFINIQPLLSIGFESDLANYFSQIIAVIEKLTKKNLSELTALEPAKEELSQLFEKLKNLNGFHILKKDGLQFFKHLFAQVKYFQKEKNFLNIQILSTLEARLLNFDLMIISSLNQNDFPQIEGDNWLGRKLRKDLGIDVSAKKYGQNAYDFCNYLSNKSVIMTRCKNKNSAIAIASPFILRFEILCKKFAIKIKNGEEYFLQLKKSEGCEGLKIKDKIKIAAKPKKEFRPKKLAITDIAKLLSDPYQIYAKRVLCLRELNKIDYEPQFKEFGSFVHEALEQYLKNPDQKNFFENAQEIFAKYFYSDEAKLIWWVKFENIFKNFIALNSDINPVKNWLELPVKLKIKDVLISGKIDRVSFFENEEVAIYDYKTGQIPANKDVACGLQPQLTIYALMLCGGILQNIKNIAQDKIISLNYWKISPNSDSEIRSVFKSNAEIAIAIAAAKSGLEKLIDYYEDENNSYEISTTNNHQHEYSHLARIIK